MKKIEIGVARETDALGILNLMLANTAANGGSLSASFSLEQIQAMQASMPLIVARLADEVVGFLMSSLRAASASIPIIKAMLDAYPGSDNAYVYGPICVAATQRGHGIAQAMFIELCRRLPGREGILFVRRDNAASLRAHAKMAMREVAQFTYRDSEHAVLAYVAPPLMDSGRECGDA